MEELVTLIMNSGVSVAVVVFFMYRDLKFMSQLQSTLQSLVDAVECIKEVAHGTAAKE